MRPLDKGARDEEVPPTAHRHAPLAVLFPERPQDRARTPGFYSWVGREGIIGLPGPVGTDPLSEQDLRRLQDFLDSADIS